MRRGLLVALGLICLAGLLGLAGGAWLTSTESGTRWLLRLVERQSGGRLVIGDIRGRLVGELSLSDVELRTASDTLDVASVVVAFDWAQILHRELIVDALRLGVVSLRHESSAAAAAPAELPFDLQVRDATLQSLTLLLDNASHEFETTSFVGRYRGGELQVERLVTTYQDTDLVVSGRLGFAPQVRLDLAVTWSSALAEQRWAGGATLRGPVAALEVELELREPYEMVAAGSIGLEDTVLLDIQAQWSELAVPAAELVTSGRVELTGPWNAFDYRSQGELKLADQRLDYEAGGSAEPAGIDVDALVLHLAQGELRAAGRVDLEQLRWEFTIEGAELDPSWLRPDWPGRLSASGVVSGGLEPTLHLELEAFEVAGELREVEIQGSFDAAYRAPNLWRLAALELRSGTDSLALSGTLGETLDADVKASLQNLELFWPGLAGQLAADLHVTGTLARPYAEGSASVRELSYAEYAAQRIELVGTAGSGGALDLDLQATGLRAPRAQIANLNARLDGTLDSHRLQMTAAGSDWGASLDGRGELAAGNWRVAVARSQLTQATFGSWQLDTPTAVSLARNAVVVEPLCFSQATTTACAELRLTGGAEDRLALSARNFNLQALNPLFGDEWSAQGQYELAATFTDLTGRPAGELRLLGGATQVSFTASERDVVQTGFDRMQLVANLEERGLAMRATLEGRDTGQVSLDASLADVTDRNAAIQAQLDIFWPELAFVSLLSPDIGDVGGSLQVALEVAGSANNPEVQGQARWTEGAVEVPAWGVRVDRIDGTATSLDGTALQFEANGWLGGSQLNLSGSSRLDPASGWPTTLRLTGDSVQIVDLRDAEIFVSPNLNIEVDLPNVQVSGVVHVPSARLSLDELPPQAVQPSPDAVVHGLAELESVRPLQVTSDIVLSLGDDVTYTGSNLNSRLSGALRVLYASGRTANASGAVRLDGSYDAYGQSLALDRGELIFAGPLDNPALDVRAVRNIGEITVGVQLNGTLQAPETRMFSDPAMSEADALSYLLIGRPLAGSGDEDSAIVQGAALSMGLQQALPVVQRIGETLGFDEFAIESNDVDTGALMAGKYLSPKLYMRYSYGLFNRIGGLLLRFRINERLSIETRSGDQESMDLLYTVEKD